MSKLKTILSVGVEPLIEGKRNFYKPIQEVEELAEERSVTCVGCKYYKTEPISFLRIKDKRLPQLNEMMCGDCGCELPYKLRQSISKCDKWQH